MKKKIIKVNLADLKLKSNKVKELLDLEENDMIDKIIGNGVFKVSVIEVKRGKDAIDYIELLRTKYKFATFSLEENQYIMTFYDYDSKQFGTSTIFDISDAIVDLFENKQIIGRWSNLSVGYTNFSYFLQSWAQEYLNEQLKKGK